MEELLIKGSDKLGIQLSREQRSLFIIYYNELKKWGSKINLTSLLDDEARLTEELFLDSLATLKIISPPETCHKEDKNLVLDIGSGGGFPGIPMKIANPSLRITLSDSVEKKIFFLKHVIRALHLTDIKAVKTTYGADGAPHIEKKKFHWAMSKAVTDIKSLGLWAGPHLIKGGKLICLKGTKERSIFLDGYLLIDDISYLLPLTRIKRRLFVYEKL